MSAWHAHVTLPEPGRSNDRAAAALSAKLWLPMRRIGFLFAKLLLGRGMRMSEFAEKIKKNIRRSEKPKKVCAGAHALSLAFV